MKKTFILYFTAVIFYSCSKSGGDGGGGGGNNCASVPKSFSADVNPIVQSFCNKAGCHNAGSANGPGPLTNYTEVFNNRVAIRASIQSGNMPRGAALSTAQKNSFLCWIDSGAPNN